MTIDLFEKGTGLSKLKELYHLQDDDISWVQDNLFEYDGSLISLEEVEEIIQTAREFLYETEESLNQIREEMLGRNSMTRCVKDNAAEQFLDRFGECDLSNVQFTLRHITAAIDGSLSIRTHGLIKLTNLLGTQSPLSTFLSDNGIVFNVPDRTVRVNGDLHSLDESRFGELRRKLYYWRGEIEAFICGEKEMIINYSCIRDCPEFISSIDSILNDGKDVLKDKWMDRGAKTFCVEFDAGLSEFSISEYPDANARELNEWIIKMCLTNMCSNLGLPEKYVALRDRIEPKRLRIIELKRI